MRKFHEQETKHMRSFYSALSYDSVISALEHDGVITVAKDEQAVSLPLEIAVDIAAETLQLLLDGGLPNHRGQNLADYLGEADELELRRILSRVAGPDTPTFTTC
jgi:hypothetical protein